MGFYRDPKRKDWIYRFQFQGKNYGARGFKTRKEAAAAREIRRKELQYQGQKAIVMAFSEAYDMYLDSAERRFTTETFNYKKYVFKNFYEFLNGDIPVIDITTQMISNYLSTLHSNNNFNVHRRELSSFFTYARDILDPKRISAER